MSHCLLTLKAMLLYLLLVIIVPMPVLSDCPQFKPGKESASYIYIYIAGRYILLKNMH